MDSNILSQNILVVLVRTLPLHECTSLREISRRLYMIYDQRLLQRGLSEPVLAEGCYYINKSYGLLHLRKRLLGENDISFREQLEHYMCAYVLYQVPIQCVEIISKVLWATGQKDPINWLLETILKYQDIPIVCYAVIHIIEWCVRLGLRPDPDLFEKVERRVPAGGNYYSYDLIRPKLDKIFSPEDAERLAPRFRRWN